MKKAIDKKKKFKKSSLINLNNLKHSETASDDDEVNKEVRQKNLSFKHKKRAQPNDATDSDADSLSEKISKDQIDFFMKKPGPHAKAGEWRKWKMMQRAIRQEREERRLLKAEKQKKQLEQEKKTKLDISSVKHKNRDFTLTIAIPSSVIDKILLKELKTCFAGQIARAATLFCVDEIVVYNEYSTVETDIQRDNYQQFIKILEYLECPQYLRKQLFPPNKYLEHVGLLNPLEAPHHFKLNDEWSYREGVVTDIPTKENKGSWVDIGLRNKIQVDKKLQTGIRVTVKKEENLNGGQIDKFKGIIVSPETPRQQMGLYWGYQVRYASSFRKILSESCFREKYNLKIGINNNNICFDHIERLPRAKRVLVVYGGQNGLEAGMESDEKLKANKLEQIFDYVAESSETNAFGSRSIRLEEALIISLSMLRPKLMASFESQDSENDKDDEENDEAMSENNDYSEQTSEQDVDNEVLDENENSVDESNEESD